MKSLQKFLLLCFFIGIPFFMTGCDDDDDINGNETDNVIIVDSIIGTWEWVSSIGGIAGNYITPDSIGITKIIDIKPQSIFEIYQNDTLILSSFFGIYPIESIITGDTTQAIVIDDLDIALLISYISSDTLILSENCIDCYSSTYIRITL